VPPLKTSYGSHFITFQLAVSSLKNAECEIRVPVSLTLYVPITAVIGGLHVTVMVPSAEVDLVNQVEAFGSGWLTK
jgi:hypothetical protein